MCLGPRAISACSPVMRRWSRCCGPAFSRSSAAGSPQRILVVGGFAEVGPAGLTVLADMATPVEDVDPAVIADAIKNTEEDVADAKDDAARDKASS